MKYEEVVEIIKVKTKEMLQFVENSSLSYEEQCDIFIKCMKLFAAMPLTCIHPDQRKEFAKEILLDLSKDLRQSIDQINELEELFKDF